jgi:hypothetical protein
MTETIRTASDRSVSADARCEQLGAELRKARADLALLRRERDGLARELEQRFRATHPVERRADDREPPPPAPTRRAARAGPRRVSPVGQLPPRAPAVPAIPLTAEQLGMVAVGVLVVMFVVVLSWLI